MKRLILAGAIAAACMLASGSPAAAAARNFDCSKAGNANKAACKGAVAKPAAAATAARPAPKAAPRVAATTTRSVTRTYDCTKAGNANKSQCKGSTTVASSTTKAAPAAPAKPTLMQRMSNVLTGGSTAPAAKRPAPARKVAAAAPASVEDHNPAGAIAQCKDGTYSHSKGRTGACSRHGGVARWS